MRKIIVLGQLCVLFFTLSVKAQTVCTMIGIPSTEILKEALENLSSRAIKTNNFELFDIKMIRVDNLRSDPRVVFQTHDPKKLRYMDYTVCGDEISFSEIKSN